MVAPSRTMFASIKLFLSTVVALGPHWGLKVQEEVCTCRAAFTNLQAYQDGYKWNARIKWILSFIGLGDVVPYEEPGLEVCHTMTLCKIQEFFGGVDFSKDSDIVSRIEEEIIRPAKYAIFNVGVFVLCCVGALLVLQRLLARRLVNQQLKNQQTFENTQNNSQPQHEHSQLKNQQTYENTQNNSQPQHEHSQLKHQQNCENTRDNYQQENQNIDNKKKQVQVFKDQYVFKVSDTETLYESFNIPENAKRADIIKAYRHLSKKVHPDRNIGRNTTTQFQELLQAYKILSSPKDRKLYDTELEKERRTELIKLEEVKLKKRNASLPSIIQKGSLVFEEYQKRTCFTDFDTSHNGFYRIYGLLFRTMNNLELECESSNSFMKMQDFGDEYTPLRNVVKFYTNWEKYKTSLPFKPRPQAGNKRKPPVVAMLKSRLEFDNALQDLLRYMVAIDPRIADDYQPPVRKQKKAGTK